MSTVALACAFDSCERAGAYARGLCRGHYNTAWKRGEIDRYARARRAKVDRGVKPTHCEECEEPFASRAVRDTWTRFCSKACSAKAAIKAGCSPLGTEYLTPEERSRREFERGENSRRKRRARLYGVKRDRYTTEMIAERDEYVCALCGERVDMAIKHPNPMSPSVDHIIPLSKGGEDTLANVQLAHLRCNLSKGPRA